LYIKRESYQKRSKESQMEISPPKELKSVHSNPHLTLFDRIRIWVLSNDCKWSDKQIVDYLNFTYPTVAKWKNTYDFEDKPRSGRPIEYDINIYERLQREHQEWSPFDIRQNWPIDEKGKVPSISTIVLMRKQLHVKEYHNKTIHQFTKSNLNDRIRCAKKHQGRDKKKSVIFVDETSRGRQASQIRLHVFPDDHPHFQSLEKIKGFSGHFFAGISYRDRTPLISYERKLDGKDYQLLLDNYVIPLGDQYYGWNQIESKRLWKLCQDGDGAHVSTETTEYLDQMDIQLFDHPAWSPDMNPMERLWSILWHEVAKRRPRSNQELITFAKQVWDGLDQKIIQNTIDDLDRIYKWIIERDGILYKFGK